MSRRGMPPATLEIAAALLVPAASYGFVRVFAHGDSVIPIVGAALLSTAVAVLLRRLRVPLPAAAAISLFFLMALIANRFTPNTVRFGFIPTGATLDEARVLADELVINFQELKTPVEALNPFIATAMIAAWVMAFLTDWGALRLRLAFEPVLPAGLLFIFSAVLGAGTHRVITTVVFAVAIAFWAVVQRTVNLAEGNAWLANDRRRGTTGVAQAAAVFAAMAVIAGIVVGPRLPGADAQEMLSFRDQGDPTRVVVSPFVSIEARLVEQSATQLFTVASSQPSYWRLAGLDEYDDNIWKVAGNFSPEDGELPGSTVQGGAREDVQQDFTIDALREIWLPAAFAPAEIVETTARLTWNAESGSLTVANDIPNSDGVEYSLVSSIPRFTAEELTAASEVVPLDIAERYLPLPEVPPLVRSEAQRVTADATTRYDKMLALQAYFRSFEYSVNLSPPDGRDPLEQFLDERVGFCQQFAGTFAVMARTLGIPARVAIGFTWGDPIGQTEDGRTVYQVTGRQTHAWPEVWFDGLGWVAFEPTPGRGAPAAVEYTGLPAAQDSLIQPDNPGGPVTTTTQAPSSPGDFDDQGPLVPEIDIGGGEGGGGELDGGGGISLRTALWILGIAAVAVAYAGGIPAYQWFRRQQRRQRIDSPATGVETAWAEATESLELGYGLQRRPAETRREYARRLASDMRVPREEMGELANKVTVARYYPSGLSDGDAVRADELAATIEQSIASRVPTFTRWKRTVDPRRLFTRSPHFSMSSVLPSRPASETNGHRPPSVSSGSGDASRRSRSFSR